jgi:hypothetical protein
LNGTHPHIVYADGNLLENEVNTIKKNTEIIPCTGKEVCLEVNTEKNKCMSTSRHQNAGENHNIKTANRPFENVTEVKHLRTTVTNQNLIHEEIKTGLNPCNAC